ncbi:MAG: hypothetical protein ACOY93_19625 [Bacillota bacterium]
MGHEDMLRAMIRLHQQEVEAEAARAWMIPWRSRVSLLDLGVGLAAVALILLVL